jgi:hypothetical protein
MESDNERNAETCRVDEWNEGNVDGTIGSVDRCGTSSAFSGS